MQFIDYVDNFDASLVHRDSCDNYDCTRIVHQWSARILGHTKNRNACTESTLFDGQNKNNNSNDFNHGILFVDVDWFVCHPKHDQQYCILYDIYPAPDWHLLFMVCIGRIYHQCDSIHNYIFTKIKENKINKTQKNITIENRLYGGFSRTNRFCYTNKSFTNWACSVINLNLNSGFLPIKS